VNDFARVANPFRRARRRAFSPSARAKRAGSAPRARRDGSRAARISIPSEEEKLKKR